MQVVRDDLWLCVDCLLVAVNDDASGIDDAARESEVRSGLAKLGPYLVPDFDTESGDGHEEFSTRGCDGCDSNLAGELHRFAILGEVET